MRHFAIIFSLVVSAIAFGQTPINVTPANNNTTFSTCNGFIIDSGGQGGSGYSNNENITITICPDTPGDIMNIVFNLFALSTTDDNPAANITNVDYMDVYDGNSTAAPTLGTYTGSQLQGVIIQATALNPTGCLTIRFRSNTVGTGMFTASATCETPCATPTAAGNITNGETLDSTRVCIGESVSFTGNGSFAAPGFNITNYEWDFMDGSTATGQNVSHTWDTPGQYLVQLFVTDDNGCGNTNLIDLQVFVATIPNFVNWPDDTTLCLGESVSFTATPELYPVLWDGFPGSQTIDDGCLPDTLLGVSQDVEIMQTGFTPGSTIQSVADIESFCIDLEHSFMGDIVIIVQCPSGQTQILHQQGGGGTQIGEPNPLDNVDCSDPSTQGIPYTYCFTPMATETWVEWVNNSGFGGTIPAGDYEPIQPFDNLLGCPLNGIWTLTVIDNWAADDGTLFAFDINLDPSLYPPVTTFEPSIGLGSDSSYWNTPATYATVSPNGDVLNVNPTAAGTFTYNYTVLDDFGCEHSQDVSVTVNDNPQADAGPDITICNGEQVQLLGTVSGGSLNCDYTLDMEDSFGDGWNGNNLLVTVNGVTTSYTVDFGTSNTVSFPVTNGQPFTVQFDGAGAFLDECSYEVVDPSGNVVFADGGAGQPSTTVHNFVGNCLGDLQFSWSPAANVTDPNINDPFTNNISTATTLTLTVFPTGHPLCATTDDVNVTISASAYPGQDSTLQICSQAAPQDLFPLLGPGASPNGSWFGPTGATVTMPYDPVTMNPGIYTYAVDSNGCTSEAEIIVQELNTVVSAVPTNANCHGISNGSALITYQNATDYQLNGGPATPLPASPFTIPGLAAGNYTVDVFNAAGCTGQVTFTITEPPALQITSITNDDVVCVGDQTPLNATGTGGSTPYTFTWVANMAVVGTGVPLTVSPNVTTQYCVILSEACGSEPDTACVTLTVPQPVNIDITPDDPNGCYPHAVNFTNNSTPNTAVTQTTVDYGDGTPPFTVAGSAAFSHVYQDPGLYDVTITIVSDSGCTYTYTYNNMIEVYDIPTASFSATPNPTTMFETHVTLINSSSSDVVSYQWTMPGATPASATTENVQVDYPEGTAAQYLVTLMVTNQYGCVDEITQTIEVESDVILYAPNTFTPDGDENNQQWFVYVDGIDMSSFELRIMNRWGEVIFESFDPKGKWDGTYNGRVVPQGTYVWTIRVKDIKNDAKYDFDGHINIIY
jgi:gliding motility-associated-like protein